MCDRVCIIVYFHAECFLFMRFTRITSRCCQNI